MRIWNATTGLEIGEPRPHTGGVQAVDWSRHLDHPRLATLADNGVVTIWDLVSDRSTIYLDAERDGGVRWSSDGSRLVSSGYRGTVMIWDATVGYKQFKTVSGK
jgi:WD40 repeat protein